MKTSTFSIKFILLLLVTCNLSAQQFISEQIKSASENTVSDRIAKPNFNEENYTKILDANGIKNYISNRSQTQNISTNATNNIADVTLDLNFQFDPSVTDVFFINVFSEGTGYSQSFSLTSNPLSINVPEGTYDIVTQFSTGTIVVKEQVSVTAATSVDINIDEATTLVRTSLIDENGDALEPGVYDPATNTVIGGSAEMDFDSTFLFQPMGLVLGNNFYQWISKDDEADQAPWNFYINDVSDRYLIRQNAIALGYNGKYYVSKYPTLAGVSGDTQTVNDANGWVAHQQKFKPTVLGEEMTELYGGFIVTETLGNSSYGGWSIYDTDSEYDQENGLNFYLNNSIDADLAQNLVEPLLVDHLAVLFPPFGEEPFTIKSPFVFTDQGSIRYGSDDITSSLYFLGNDFYTTPQGDRAVLTNNPRFSYTAAQSQNVVLGSTVPILTSAYFLDRARFKYKGRNNENRESDFFNTDVVIKKNNDIVFSGTYIESRAFTYPTEGDVEITFTNNNNNMIDGMDTSNITKMTYTGGSSDVQPPTLQMLQFRDEDDNVTDHFNTGADATVRIAAGDFSINPSNDVISYVSGSTVSISYSLHGQNDWTSIELTEYPEYFFMPAFGDYYEANLENVGSFEANSWYDAKTIVTDANGNTQEQIISPAFKIDEPLATEDFDTPSGFSLYPNPTSNSVRVVVPQTMNGALTLQVIDLAGRTVYTETRDASNSQPFVYDASNLAPGMYVVKIIGKKQTISKKLIKK